MRSRLFSPRATTVFRATLVAAALVVVLGATGYYHYYRSPFWNGVGVAHDQPVLFSHRHHAGELRIDCRYCHTSVETSPFAGMPGTRTCLTCHSQLFTDSPMLEPVVESARTGQPLPWNRITALPDHVYFNHSIHIAKGVACVTCHGDIGSMALTSQGKHLHMRWCVDCHRDPGPGLEPALDTVFVPHPVDRTQAADVPRPAELLIARDVRTDALTNCSTCHH
ncbi:MAG: cytochrome c3 family protein [Opitutaceae bacterium]